MQKFDLKDKMTALTQKCITHWYFRPEIYYNLFLKSYENPVFNVVMEDKKLVAQSLFDRLTIPLCSWEERERDFHLLCVIFFDLLF